MNILLVLGKNWNQKTKSTAHVELSLPSKQSARAAALVADNYDAIVFSTGKTCPNWDVSEARAMRDFFRQYRPDYQAVYLEEISNDTPSNMAHSKPVLDSLAIDRQVDILTVSFHLSRSLRLARNYGIFYRRGLSSEEILWQFGESRLLPSHTLQTALRYLREHILEGILRVILVFDKKGTLPRRVTNRIRANKL